MKKYVFTAARKRALKKAQSANKRGKYVMTEARKKALKKAQVAARKRNKSRRY